MMFNVGDYYGQINKQYNKSVIVMIIINVAKIRTW